MRGGDDLGVRRELLGDRARELHRRLLLEAVERGAGELAAVERGEERVLDDDAAAGDVEEARAVLHLGDLLLADEALRALQQRHVHREEVRAREHLVERHQRGAYRQRELRCGERVARDDVHAEARGAARDLPPDAAEADDAEGFPGEARADEAGAAPAAGLEDGVGLRDEAGHGAEQGDGVLGGGDAVAGGRVDDDDAALAGGVEVDVVDADAGAADDLEVGGGLEDLAGDGRRGADDDGVVGADDVLELLGREVVAAVHVELCAQNVEPLLRQLLRHEHREPRRVGHGDDGAGGRKAGRSGRRGDRGGRGHGAKRGAERGREGAAGGRGERGAGGAGRGRDG
mmetsp:Transcript_11999/g.31770  ORF Transcript_11999/g.31770 Transcript_11999/m.31770 type:complete len:344 (+) Transcript_11999:1289-2320(+)